MGGAPSAYAVKTFALALSALSLLALCTGPAGAFDREAAFAQPLDQEEKQTVVTRAGAMLAAQYIDPDRARDGRAKITTALADGAYDGITDPAVFAKRLTDDLAAALHDKHVFVSASLVPTPPDADVAGTTPPPTTGGFARVDRLKGNIGYIRLLSFPMPAIFNAAADEAMRAVAGTDALIIDLRDNAGGNVDSESFFGSYFFDPQKPVQLNSVVERVARTTNRFTKVRFWTRPVLTPYLNKPVYVLAGPRTYSAAEAFAYDLKARGRAVIYGQTTGGAANPGVGRLLNARFGIFIPIGRNENPVTGTNWEGVGVTPDVPVDEKRAFQAAVRDILSGRADPAAIDGQPGVDTGVDSLVEDHLLNIRTTPRPGSEAAVRRNIQDLIDGTPNYSLMSRELAETIRLQLPRLRHDLGSLGPIASVTFRYVGTEGLDVFDVTMANGSLQSGIFAEPDGKIETAWIHPVPSGVPDKPQAGPGP